MPEALAWSCQTSAATKENAGGNFAADVVEFATARGVFQKNSLTHSYFFSIAEHDVIGALCGLVIQRHQTP